ncbi:putative reverse transcriptase domain-containing protein [Tanacetum coccineum]
MSPSIRDTNTLPISVPTSSPPLLLPSTSRREDRTRGYLYHHRKELGYRYLVLDTGWRWSSSAAAARPLETSNMHIHSIRWRQKARFDREAWRRIDGNAMIMSVERLIHCALPYWVQCQRSERLHEADRRRSAVTFREGDSTTVTGDHHQGQWTALQGQVVHYMGHGHSTIGHVTELNRDSRGTPLRALAARDANRNGDDSHTSGTGGRRTERIVRECTYQDFMKCKPLYYQSTEADLRKKMTDKYCLRNEMKKLEAELWNLKVKGTDVIGLPKYTQRECPKLKNNKNRGNQVGNDRAPAKVYVVGRAGTNPDSNIVTGTFLLNNRYASILFDTGADRSFVSTTFSFQMDITPSTLDHYYDVELADGRIIRLNTILRGCTLNLLNHQFNINLMPVELGSFNAIIGMDWLAKYQAIIVCAEKIVRIPWENETLNCFTVNESNQGHGLRQHYYLEVKDKSEKKRLKDAPIVRDFLEVFPEDLPGLPPTRQVEFQINLVPGAAPV